MTERKRANWINRLIREDKRPQDTDETDSALALQVQAMKLKKGRNDDRMKTREERQREIEELKKKTHCGICKEKGHWYRECPKKNTPSEKKSEDIEAFISEVSASKETVAYICDISAFYSHSNEYNETISLADSGVRMLMNFRKEYFTSLEYMNNEVFIKTADDEKNSR